MFRQSDSVVVPPVADGVLTEHCWLAVGEQIYFYWIGNNVVDIAAQKIE